MKFPFRSPDSPARRNPSEAGGRVEDLFDVDYLRTFARAHEAGGFDRVLIGYGSTSPDGLHLGTYVYFPLASGLLSGKYRSGQPYPEGTRLSAPGSRVRDHS